MTDPELARLLAEALDMIEMLWHPKAPARKAHRERWIADTKAVLEKSPEAR